MPTRDSIYHWSGENVQRIMSFIRICFGILSQLKDSSNHLPQQEPSRMLELTFIIGEKSLQSEMRGYTNWAPKTKSPAFIFNFFFFFTPWRRGGEMKCN